MPRLYQFGGDCCVCVIVQAVNTQEANKAASNRLPPLWAMVAMILLGWNEAMSILTSPVRLVRPQNAGSDTRLACRQSTLCAMSVAHHSSQLLGKTSASAGVLIAAHAGNACLDKSWRTAA